MPTHYAPTLPVLPQVKLRICSHFCSPKRWGMGLAPCSREAFALGAHRTAESEWACRRIPSPFSFFQVGGMGACPHVHPRPLPLFSALAKTLPHGLSLRRPFFIIPQRGYGDRAPMFKRSPCPLPLFPPARSASQPASRFRFYSYPQNTAQYPAHRRNHSPKRAATGW